jgi:hypothetical protein
MTPSRAELERLFIQKYGDPARVGWSPNQRFRFGYYRPADVYEATIAKLIHPGCAWIDVGGGHSIFPENPGLARSLISRCSHVVAVDPSDNVNRNEFVHERVQRTIEHYCSDRLFDVATLRMVAEHVEEPNMVVRALNRLLRLGGLAVLLTVNLRSPIATISRLTPFQLHHPIKKLIWGGEERDTFPVRYRMNTRRALRTVFAQHGFREREFAFLDDLSAFGRFRVLSRGELWAWKFLKTFGLRYPENCLLGVYEKQAD